MWWLIQSSATVGCRMNKKAQKSGVFGFALLAVGLIFILTSFALIDPFKEFLDTARDTSSLNCPGTTNFNQTDYDDDNSLEKLTRRPTCFVTGMLMVYFIGAFLISVMVWIVANWRRLSG